MPARAFELVAELRQQGKSVLLGPSLLGATSPVPPRTPLSRPRPLGLDERPPPATYTRSMNRKLRRSVAARPPSRLLTGTSLGSEPVVLTVPTWGNETTSGTPGTHPATVDPETDQPQSPIRGLPQPTGCRPIPKSSPPPLGASSWQRVQKTVGFLLPSVLRSLDFRGH